LKKNISKIKTKNGGVKKMALIEATAGIAIASSIAIFGGAIGTAMAQSAIGTAAMGVIAEKPEQAGKLIIWIAIPETIVIFGFVIAILLALSVGGGAEVAAAAA
tara:strand:+ start:14229 stop:14540 length:312 start_codon:yes stop_codon:yes gene_type:complete